MKPPDTIDPLTRQISEMHQRLAVLTDAANSGAATANGGGGASSPSSSSAEANNFVIAQAFAEIGTSLEELQVAEAELRAQNEAILEGQSALEAERRNYQELFEFAPDGYLVTDSHGTIRQANRAAAALLRLDAHFLIGKPLITFVPEAERTAFRQALVALNYLPGEERVPEWMVMLHPRNGTPFAASLHVAVERRDAQGNPLGLRWMIRDITERVRAEAEIRALNADLEKRVQARTASLEIANRTRGELLALLETLFAQAPAGMAFLDRDLRYVRVNETLAAMHPLPLRAHAGWMPWELHADRSPLQEPLLRQVLETGEAIIAQEQSAADPADPTYRSWWLVSYYPVRVRGDELYGVGVIVSDITERKEAEAERERLLAQFDAVVDQMPAGLVLAEAPSGRILRVNRRAEALWGGPLPPSEAIADYQVFTGFHADGRPYAPEEWPMARAIRTGEIIENEDIEIARGSGESDDTARVILRLAASPIRSRAGAIIAAVTTFQDVTELKRAETLQAEALARERRISETLQASLLLKPVAKAFPGLDLETIYVPALDEAQVGGDFFDVFRVAGGQVALVVGDASGKGLDAAARTVEVKYALRAFLRSVSDPDPARCLAQINQLLCDAEREEPRARLGFISLCLALLNLETGQVSAAVAGAEPPLIVRAADGKTENASPITGIVLGIEDNIVYDTIHLTLAPGDTLILVTDGITEAHRAGVAAMLDFEGMQTLAETAGPAAPLPRLGAVIVEGARAFAGGAFHDDVCLLLARRAVNAA